MVQSIQYYKYLTLYHDTEVEAVDLAENYCNNKKEKDISSKGMKKASKKNARIVGEELVSCHQTTLSIKKGKEEKTKPITTMG